MEVRIVKSTDCQILKQIKHLLSELYPVSQTEFQDILPLNTDQPCFAILVDQQGQIAIIAHLQQQYKLTRGLSKCIHLELLYGFGHKEQLDFQRQLKQKLDCYKIVALKLKDTEIFIPKEVFMEYQVAQERPGL